jgi:hypothetical protein
VLVFWRKFLIQKCKESRNYYLSKLYKAADGEIDPSFSIAENICSETLTAVDMKYIQLDRRTKNMIPIYFNFSELSQTLKSEVQLP